MAAADHKYNPSAAALSQRTKPPCPSCLVPVITRAQASGHRTQPEAHSIQAREGLQPERPRRATLAPGRVVGTQLSTPPVDALCPSNYTGGTNTHTYPLYNAVTRPPKSHGAMPCLSKHSQSSHVRTSHYSTLRWPGTWQQPRHAGTPSNRMLRCVHASHATHAGGRGFTGAT